MPNIKYLVESDYEPTFRTKKIEGMFDYSPDKKIKLEWDISLPIEEKEWGIGLIVGSSGSGKSTLAKNAFRKELVDSFEYDKRKSFIDSFSDNVDVKDIVKTLTSVGFSSVPSWFSPYHVLSTGQKFRVDVARAVLENDFTVFDEFTSVVDRTVAKSTCVALSKYIIREGKKFVAVTCHYDVEEYLQPDWVFDVSKNEFKWGCLRRPRIEVKVRKAERSEWTLFRKHHYLDTNLSNASQCYIAEIDGQPCGFVAVIHFPHPSSKIMKKEHRTVVLPDFQGLGIGVMLSDFVADIYKKKGFRFMSLTSHPAMISYRGKSKKWKLTRMGRTAPITSKSNQQSLRRSLSNSRNTASFEYIGE